MIPPPLQEYQMALNKWGGIRGQGKRGSQTTDRSEVFIPRQMALPKVRGAANYEDLHDEP